MSVFAVEYHSYYAYLFCNFLRLKKTVEDDKLAQIDAIAQKHVKMSYDTGSAERSHHLRNRTSGHIVVHRAYLPALLEELVPVFEKIESGEVCKKVVRGVMPRQQVEGKQKTSKELTLQHSCC